MTKLEVAGGKCGIAKNPQEVGVSGVVRKKGPPRGGPVGGGGGQGGGGCTMEGGWAFFVTMLREIYPYNPSEKWVEDRWQSWRTQLGLS